MAHPHYQTTEAERAALLEMVEQHGLRATIDAIAEIARNKAWDLRAADSPIASEWEADALRLVQVTFELRS